MTTDITFCNGVNSDSICPFRETCRRYDYPKDFLYLSFMKASHNDRECENYLPIKTKL